MSYIPNDTYKKNDTSFDSWKRPKVFLDYSLFHSLFTFDVPNSLWEINENGIILKNTNLSTKIFSDNGTLKVKSGINPNDYSILESLRNPRYQPNRGHLFSTAVYLPNPTADGIRDFGLFNSENGVFYRLKPDGKLYAVVRSNSVEVVEQEIITNFNIDFNHLVCDIDFQSRGFGDFTFYIKNPISRKIEIVHEIKIEDFPNGEVSIANPALPVSFKSTNITQEVEIGCGSVNIDSSGGKKENRIPSQLTVGNSGVTINSTEETPIMAIKVNRDFNGKLNTRDITLQRMVYNCDGDSVVNIYITRDEDTLTGSNWNNIGNHNNMQYALDGDINFNKNNNVVNLFSTRSKADDLVSIDNPDMGPGDFYISGGSYIIITSDPKISGKTAWVTLEWSEEV